MRYFLRKAVIEPVPKVDIEAHEFGALESARTILRAAFSIEEKYEILISNYLELERELLSIAASRMVRNTLTYADSFRSRSILNTRVVNLLTAAKLLGLNFNVEIENL